MAGLVLLSVGTLLRFSGRPLGLLAVAGHAPSHAAKRRLGRRVSRLRRSIRRGLWASLDPRACRASS